MIPLTYWFFSKIVACKGPGTLVNCIIVGLLSRSNRLNHLTFRVLLSLCILPFRHIYRLQIIDLSR